MLSTCWHSKCSLCFTWRRASYVSRNRFIAVPVLTLQPEITRIRAEGRGSEVDIVTSAFFKASVMMGASRSRWTLPRARIR